MVWTGKTVLSATIMRLIALLDNAYYVDQQGNLALRRGFVSAQ